MYNQNSDLMKQEKFTLPTMTESDFSAEELAEDADGLQMSFQRVKIPAGGTLQFEMPSDDPDTLSLHDALPIRSEERRGGDAILHVVEGECVHARSHLCFCGQAA